MIVANYILPPSVDGLTLDEVARWCDSREFVELVPQAKTRSKIRKAVKAQVASTARIATAAQSVAGDGKEEAPKLDAVSLTMALCALLASYGWASEAADALGANADPSMPKNVSTLRARGVVPPPVNFLPNHWRYCPGCSRDVPVVSGGVPVSETWRRGQRRKRGRKGWRCVDCHQGSIGGADKVITDWSNTPAHEYTTASPSAAVIQNLARRQKGGKGARLEQAQLASAAEKTLLAEINHYRRTGTIASTASD